MKRSALLAALVVLAGLALSGLLETPARAEEPGAAMTLTSFGRNVWNLEALLRATFARRNLYIDYGRSGHRANFTTTPRGNVRGGYYRYTFLDPTSSDFRLVRPANPPRPKIGASGGETPITIRGAYVQCPHGQWLYMHFGNGPANWDIGCLPRQ